MSRTSKALKRLGVAGLAAVTIGAGVPALVATSAQAAPGGATTQLTITPSTQQGAAGTCIIYSVTPFNATGEQPSDTAGQTIKLEATENPVANDQQVSFCAPTAPFANSGTPTTLLLGSTATGTATAPADPNPSGAQRFGVRGRVPGGANLRAYIDSNSSGTYDAGEPTALATATFTAGGSDNTSDTTLGGNSAQDAVKTMTEIPQSVTANPVAANGGSASDQFVTVLLKNASGDPVSGVLVSAQYGSGSANGAQTTPAAAAQPITCRGGGTTNTGGTITRSPNTSPSNAAGSQDQANVSNNSGIVTCSFNAVRAGTDTLILYVNQTTGGTSGPDAGEPQITVTRTTQTAPNTNVAQARNIDLTPEGPIDTVSGQTRTFTATVTDAAGKRVQGVEVTFGKTGGGNLSTTVGTTNAFGQASTNLTSVAGEQGQAVVTASINADQTTIAGTPAPGVNETQCQNPAGTPAGSTAGNCTDSEVTNFVAASPSPSPSSTTSPTSSPTASPTGTPARSNLTLTVNTPTIPAGATGTLTATGSANQQYELQCYTRPSTTYFTARSGAFNAAGDPVTFTLSLGRNTRCFIQYATNSASGASGSVVINVRTVLSLSTVRTGVRTYIFQGRNLPRVAGQLITLYRVDSSGNEIRTTNLITDASGIYRVTRKFTGSGTFLFRVRTPQTLNNAAGVSNTINVRVF